MKHRKWIIVGGAVAVVGLLIAGISIFYGTFSARSYIANNFTRSVAHDIGRDALAYTSTKSVSEVSRQITKAWQPADKYSDSSGVYLRYSDDTVVIRAAGAGSLILVEELTTAYPRYRHTVGSAWSATRGTNVRGGGPGAGK